MLDTDQLRSFLAIVDTGSFTRASQRVNKTQSAVSMHPTHVPLLGSHRGVKPEQPMQKGTYANADARSPETVAQQRLDIEDAVEGRPFDPPGGRESTRRARKHSHWRHGFVGRAEISRPIVRLCR